MAADKKAAKAPPKKAKTPFAVKFSIFMLMVTAVIFFPTTVLVAVCMTPTYVAGLVDPNRPKTMWVTIGAMNLAGTLPSWMKLWEMGHGIDDALSLLMQPMTVIIAYGAAGVGWVIQQNITPFVANVIVRKNQNRLKDIEKRRKELIRKWGADVA